MGGSRRRFPDGSLLGRFWHGLPGEAWSRHYSLRLEGRRTTAARFGKMPTTSVRRRISRLRRSCGLFDHTCIQCDREGGEDEDLRLGLGEHRRGLGEAALELLHHPGVLCVDLGSRRLLKDRPHRPSPPAPPRSSARASGGCA